MSTTSPRPQDSAVLGESWVVPSRSPGNEQQKEPETPTPSPRRRSEADKNDGSDSMGASASWISGPELIMPSICEAPVLEESWVTPHVRTSPSSPSPSPSQMLKRRHKPSSRKATEDPDKTSSNTSDNERPGTPKDRDGDPSRASRPRWEMSIRVVINLALIAVISHLLVFPELVHHCRSLCSIQMISSLYMTNCAQPYCALLPLHHRTYTHNHPPTRHDSALSLQTQLELFFNSTLEEITPYANTLPETESSLQDIQTALKKSHSGPQHELTLEFDGCQQALSTAIRKLSSLKADLRSAVGSLMATNGLPPSQQHHRPNAIAKDARHSTQMARREKYLDQLATRMRLKTDSLTGDFATLADHLESLKGVVERQVSARSGNGDEIYKNLRTLVNSIVPDLRMPR